jgi:hypothetical protein
MSDVGPSCEVFDARQQLEGSGTGEHIFPIWIGETVLHRRRGIP